MWVEPVLAVLFAGGVAAWFAAQIKFVWWPTWKERRR